MRIRILALPFLLLFLVSCAPKTESVWFKENTSERKIISQIDRCYASANAAMGAFIVPRELRLSAFEYKRLYPSGDYTIYLLESGTQVGVLSGNHRRDVRNIAQLCMYEQGYEIIEIPIEDN